jgi:hypothetical protein
MNLTLISAWNDSGGGLLNRLFDGHNQFYVWPYELQLGTGLKHDGFQGWFKSKYRWLELNDDMSAEDIFDAIIDDELKSSVRQPNEAKHINFLPEISYEQWKNNFMQRVARVGSLSRCNIVESYLESFFFSLERRELYSDVIAHCPVIIMDAVEIWKDFPDARFIHVVRHPAGNFYDFNRRHPQVKASDYIKKWAIVNQFAYVLSGLYPDRVKLIGLQDILQDRTESMKDILRWMGAPYQGCLKVPSWQGKEIDPLNMGPFGGVPEATIEDEQRKRKTLSRANYDDLIQGAGCDLKLFAEKGIII